MNVLRFFHSIFAKHLIFIVCALSASNALAYLKINYNSNDLYWQSEELRIDDDNYVYAGDFFTSETINFDIVLVIPDFEYSGDGVKILTFANPIIDIKTSNLFSAPAVTNSQFELEFTPWADSFYTYWHLSFDVIDNEKPQNGTARGGSFGGGGSIEWNTDGSGYGGSYSEFNYYLDNWIYKRQQMEWVLDSDVYFTGDLSSLTIEKVLVPEPLSPALLLIGLTAIIFARRNIKQKKAI